MTGRRSLYFFCIASLSCSAWSYLPSAYTSCPRLPRRGALSTIRLARTVPTRSPEFSRLYSSNVNNSRDNGDKPGKKNPLVQVKKALNQVTSKWTRFVVRFRGLSRRAKLYVMTQFSILLLVAGLLGRSAYKKHYNPTTPTSPPIEIPYSQFLDFCKGSHKDVHVANVLIGNERIGYRILKTDTEEQRRFLEGKSEQVVEIPQRRAYTRKVSASPDLLSTLRENNIAFSAAPATTNYAALSIRSFIFAFYALLLFRMYQNLSGGGSGNSPGKLASQSTVTSASFDDIEGCDSAKYEVMELVDTLRNPDKYAILGARAPTGLLLEGGQRRQHKRARGGLNSLL